MLVGEPRINTLLTGSEYMCVRAWVRDICKTPDIPGFSRFPEFLGIPGVRFFLDWLGCSMPSKCVCVC